MGMGSDGESSGGGTGVGRDRVSLRRRMERFARLRSAYRALPAAAVDLQDTEENESRARALRDKLKQLAESEGSSEELTEKLAGALSEIDIDLDAMDEEIRTQFDLVAFSSLRATIPRSSETHRHEVVALLETMLQDRGRLLERLPKVEYLITILATEEGGQRRKVAHDPVALTLSLTHFAVEGLDSFEAESIAAELYQVASLDADSESPLQILRSIRARKESIGLGCLTPTVLRAVVTYNARMFNHVEATRDTSRASDETLEELLGLSIPDVESGGSAYVGGLDESDEIWENVGGAAKSISVFDSQPLVAVIDALGRRLRGVPIGSCTSERIALVLETVNLDPLELSAISVAERDHDERILAYTAAVGLLIRDFGAVRSQLSELGLSESELTVAWVNELNVLFGQMVSEKLADGEQYTLASTLSGIKTKHLLAPMSAIKDQRGRAIKSEVIGDDDAAAEMRKVGREAIVESQAGAPVVRRLGDSQGAFQSAEPGRLSGRRRMVQLVAGVPLVLLLGFMGANLIFTEKGTIEEYSIRGLDRLSPFIKSAYRGEQGSGGLLVGRVDDRFAELSPKDRYEETLRMRDRFRSFGIREAMIYDESGRMRVHIASNKIRLPHAPPKAEKPPAKRKTQAWF